jgi:hypothetical protein
MWWRFVPALIVVAIYTPLVFVPFWASSFSVHALAECSGGQSCKQSADYFPVCGPFCGRFEGSWSTDAPAGAVFFAVAFGSLPQPGCTLNCPGEVYSSPLDQASGAFDVSFPLGHVGSIYVVMAGVESNNATIWVNGTYYAPPL